MQALATSVSALISAIRGHRGAGAQSTTDYADDGDGREWHVASL